MQFIKTHLISLLCGVATIAFIAMAALGMMSTSVTEQMNKRIKDTGARDISSLKSSPKNEQIIEAERRKGELFKAEYQKTLNVAHEINRRPALLNGVFPKPEKRSTGFEFIQAYEQALKRLPLELIAGTLPTPEEIEEERQNVTDLLALEAEQAEEGGGKAPAITQRNTNVGRRGVFDAPEAEMGVVGGGFEMGGRRGIAGGMGARGAPVARTSGEPKYDPVYRANVTKARNIRCYIDPQTFHVSPVVDVTSAPRPEDMWFTQLSLWIQQDVVAALARLNKGAAQQVTDGEACVEQMPVKRIEMLRVLGYQMPGGMLPVPGAGNTGNVAPSFTEETCNDQYDVVRFLLVVVADQRDVLNVIHEISRQNFYQCIGASYSAVGPADQQQGYFYGTEPVVRVQLDFEGYMARAVYQPLMPKEIRKRLGVDTAGDEG